MFGSELKNFYSENHLKPQLSLSDVLSLLKVNNNFCV